MLSKSSGPILVSNVTAISLAPPNGSASLAAISIFFPPRACTFIIHTPKSVATLHAFATVFGISWNFKSRKTSKPFFINIFTISGPAAVKSSFPIFTRHNIGSSSLARTNACSLLEKSSATIIRGSFI